MLMDVDQSEKLKQSGGFGKFSLDRKIILDGVTIV